MNEKNDFALVRKSSSAVEKVAPGTKRILSGMVADILAVVQVDLDALVLEGKRIRRREGMTPEDIRAFDLFHRAAVAGHGEAQLLVYECYADGHGIQEDFAKAMEWVHKSSESGFAPAQYMLADCYYHAEKDYVAAVKWYRKAAEQGDARAQCSLGLCYHDGEGVTKDYIEAVKWTRKAAEQGDVIAQKNLGFYYDRGDGVLQNYTEAAKWYQKAADQGLAGAQNDLGVCYEHGEGVSQNLSEAIKWYRKAAAQGNAESVSNLARCCENMAGDFCDFLATNTPLIGDCSLLPYPKKAIHYAIASVLNDYENKREDTTNQTLREKLEKIIPTFRYALTRLVSDWQEIEQEDKQAIAKLGRFDSFPDWALPLKLKYLDDERASIEAAEVATEVLTDEVERERAVLISKEQS